MTLHLKWDDGTDTVINTSFNPVMYPGRGVYHVYTASGTYHPQCVASLSNGMADSLDSDGPTVVSDSCEIVSGSVYYDHDANCIYDGTDSIVSMAVQVKSGNETIAAAWSPFSFHLPAYGNFTLEATDISSQGVGLICPGSWNYNFTLSGSNLQQDFAIACNTTQPDNQIVFANTSFALAGQDCSIFVSVRNFTCLPGSGTLTVALDSLHQYISSDITPDTISGNLLKFNFSNLQNYWGEFGPTITTITSPNAIMGDYFCIPVSITPADLDPSNNYKDMCGTVGSSFDPNHLRVSPLGTGASADILAGTELTYKVEFQNTGNAPATNINVADTLQSDFDLSTLQIIGSSHPMTYTLSGNALNFSFQNINLPDSGSDEAGSHGWLNYKIKPNSSAPLGTVLYNRASIYFDNNAPVMTNKTMNTINSTTGVMSYTSNEMLSVYPNPARDVVQCIIPDNFNGVVQVTNMLGNVLLSEPVQSNHFKIDCGRFSTGIYQLIARDSNRFYENKIVIAK